MKARLLSLAIHVCAIVLLLNIGRHASLAPEIAPIGLLRRDAIRLVAPAMLHGGGGGGERSPLPASLGRLPRFARRQFTPPSATPRAHALLVVEPTLIGPAEVRLPAVNLAQLGDPFGRTGPPSSGPGSGGGIGEGDQGGVGKRRGPGFGPNDGGGISWISVVAGEFTAPKVLYKVEPEFSEEARKAKYQGTVLLTLEVGEDGKPRRLRIVRGLGLGLDEKAIDAVSRWRFRPAMRNGSPVPVPATIEVNFRLL